MENEVKRLFWHELHNFQVDRAIKIIEHMTTAFGEDVVKVIEETNVDWREPLKLYMKRQFLGIQGV